jgi:hypothetical protein
MTSEGSRKIDNRLHRRLHAVTPDIADDDEGVALDTLHHFTALRPADQPLKRFAALTTRNFALAARAAKIEAAATTPKDQ